MVRVRALLYLRWLLQGLLSTDAERILHLALSHSLSLSFSLSLSRARVLSLSRSLCTPTHDGASLASVDRRHHVCQLKHHVYVN
jgi:hypothetical protein